MNIQSDTYVTNLVKHINLRLRVVERTLLYGENINYGSCLSGLAKGIDPIERHTILNVGNAELAHVGIGMGVMLDGGNAVLFVKQSDFLLLALDQIVNTYNYIRGTLPREHFGSFTIYSIVCNQGYQGPQSSLNSPQDFASLANVSTFCVNGSTDTSWVINNQFINPGFRFVFVSLRHFGDKAPLTCALSHAPDGSVFSYRNGNAATVVCTGFCLSEGLGLVRTLADKGLEVDLYHVNYVPGMLLNELIESCARSGKLIILDDSKSVSKLGDLIVSKAKQLGVSFKLLMQSRRGLPDHEYRVNPDAFTPENTKIIEFILAHEAENAS
jgi:pyruvate/2-oxoglutarate/acetoin dehydrogenase E1 component